MISKRIHCEPINDNYGRLANYIQDAEAPHRNFKKTAEYIADIEGEGEKVLHQWHAGCEADDYALAITEVQATQALNTRSTKEKTYHLLISFRPEDDHKLTPEVMEEIEKEFAEALGFQEHQRHCGAHQNTNNLHIHVAYNMIHPLTLNRREPYRDYLIRDTVCRSLEKRFGLAIDNGREPGSFPKRKNEKAQAVEAHTQQESFDGYCQRHKEELLGSIQQANDWQEVHDVLSRRGLTIKLHGNGCVIKDRHGKHAIKASSLDPSLSKGALTKRLGAYQAPQSKLQQATKELSRFEARPLQKNPERGGLWLQFKQAQKKRQQALNDIERRHKTKSARLQDEAATALATIEATTQNDADKEKYRVKHRKETSRQLKALERERKREIAEVRKQHPHPTWTGYLKDQAKTGNEIALAILRSTKEEVQPENSSHQQLEPINQDMRTQFDAVMKEKQHKLDEIDKAQRIETASCQLKWQKHRSGVDKLIKSDKFNLLSGIARKERSELRDIHAKYKLELKAIEKSYPFTTIHEYTLHIQRPIGLNTGKTETYEQQTESARRAAFRAEWQAKRDAIRSKPGLTTPDRRRLMAVSRFEQLATEESSFPQLRRAKIFSGFRYTVDAQGTVIVTLASGAILRDSGNELTFSRHPEAEEAARHIGRMKFGRFTTVDGGVMRSACFRANFFAQKESPKDALGAELAALRAELPTAFSSREKLVKKTISTLLKLDELSDAQRASFISAHRKWLKDELATCPATDKDMWAARFSNFQSFAYARSRTESVSR